MTLRTVLLFFATPTASFLAPPRYEQLVNVVAPQKRARGVAFVAQSGYEQPNALTTTKPWEVAKRVAAAAAGIEPASLVAPPAGYEPAAIDARFKSKPWEVAARVAAVGSAAAKVALAGDDGGAALRRELGKLGPVFCKVGQTLATRPDIVGVDTSRNLGQLQDAMAPESSPATAMATLQASLQASQPASQPAPPSGHRRSIEACFASLSTEPVAAASLAEVFRGTLADGREVAVKVQRPGLEEKVSLDFYVLRALLAALAPQIGSDAGLVQAVLDEVGEGIFKELDFQQEAAHIRSFAAMYRRELRDLGVVVPTVVGELSGPQVLVTEWLDGVAPRALPPRERCDLARTAVQCLAMQLMTRGFIHCDPHEGNLIRLHDGRVALIDFGLMAQMRQDHQEAMASGVLNIMAENYGALVDIFRKMGVLDPQREDLRRPGTTEPFAAALQRCMSPPDSSSSSSSSSDDGRKKLIQAEDGAARRRAFGQLYEELAELAFSYYFVIPSYYILVMRAFVTLEGIALNADDDFNMYETTAVYARRKLLTPQTAGGRALLQRALFTEDGRRALRGERTRAQVVGAVLSAAEATAVSLLRRAASPRTLGAALTAVGYTTTRFLQRTVFMVRALWRRRNRDRSGDFSIHEYYRDTRGGQEAKT